MYHPAIFRLLVALLILTFTSLAFAEEASTELPPPPANGAGTTVTQDKTLSYNPDTLPQAARTLADKGTLNIQRTFDTGIANVQGIVVKQKGRDVLLFGFQDHLFGGVVIGPNGENVTYDLMKAQGIQMGNGTTPQTPSPSNNQPSGPSGQAKAPGIPDHIAQQILDLPYQAVEGEETAPTVYVFADARCPSCIRFFKETRSAVENGKLRIHWIMVSFVSPDSDNIASAIFDEGIAALRAAKSDDGSSPYNVTIPEDHKKQLDENMYFMGQAGLSGTPGIMMKTADGWYSQSGVPSANGLQMIMETAYSHKTNTQ